MAGCPLVRCVLSGRSRSVARPAGWLRGTTRSSVRPVAGHEQDAGAPGVEGEQDAYCSWAQFLEVGDGRAVDVSTRGRPRPGPARPQRACRWPAPLGVGGLVQAGDPVAYLVDEVDLLLRSIHPSSI